MAAVEAENESTKVKNENKITETEHRVPKMKEKWNMKAFFQETPCVRSSLLNGIVGGSVLGVANFLYSKKIKRSCDVAVGGFVLGSLVSWSFCYYHRTVQLNNLQTIVTALEKRNKEHKESEHEPNMKDH